MKNYIYILLSMVIISCNSSIKNSTPQEFAETLFLCIQNNDFEKAKHLLIEPNDIVYVTSEKMKSDFKNVVESDSTYMDYIKHVELSFEDCYKRGEEIGVDWKKAQFQRVEFEYADIDGMTMLKKSYIFFNCNSREYKLYFKKTFKIGDNWKNFFLGNPSDILKGKEEMLKYS